jgi:NADPH2:quinone reductase
VIELALFEPGARLQTTIEEAAARYGAFLGFVTRVVAVTMSRRREWPATQLIKMPLETAICDRPILPAAPPRGGAGPTISSLQSPKMRALVCSRFGSIAELSVQDLPPPVPEEGQVVVQVAAAGLNYPDALTVQGKYQEKPPLPFVPGMELAGTVSAVGPGVARIRVGDAVMAIGQTGAFAEACVLPAERVLRRPSGVTPEVAAAALVTYGTAYHALKDRARVRFGETLLVLGAAGGIGSAAVDLGKALGARVIAAASTEAKLEVCRRLGADAVVNYEVEPILDRLKEFTGGRGVDVVFDPEGGAHAEAALPATGWDGRYLVVIGFAAGEIPRLPLNLALLNSRSIVGVYWADWARRDPAASEANFIQLGDWIASGRLRPALTERVPLAEIPRAMLDLVERRAVGKLVVVP